MMIALRLRYPTKVRSLLSPFQSFKLIPFSSSTASANPTSSNSTESCIGLYNHILKSQRPSSITWRKEFSNSASFIGTVTQPVKVFSSDDRFCAYTVLNVSSSNQSNAPLWVVLNMRDEMGKLCLNHLKPNDIIYVSGPLRTYTKADQSGNLSLRYKVIVKELNYVMQRCGSASRKNEEQESDEGQTVLEKYKNRLHLWQVFFANTYEWWDNRKHKISNPLLPDFKHKDTGESLWLGRNDPPWIKKQLEKVDSAMAEHGPVDRIGRRARVSEWEYDA